MQHTVVKFSENDVETLNYRNFTQHSNRSFRPLLLSSYKLTLCSRHSVCPAMAPVVQNRVSRSAVHFAMAAKKIKLDEPAISEILVADTLGIRC